ncbi:kinectin isoform X2 [Leucoraja erinacea]|uniref:kinectin isoform X2 n=1 Tax=Leucoraja erinaceus TaxID=7782 RepID=UPI002455D0A9|nr:kinectin isoform X2 [Leucoraja erinacea]
MEFYESQYLLLIIPAVVIAIIFLFFWLFMKETSYDEILAKQKRDAKPVSAKIDKKKNEKKKNKKKDNANGNMHESDSESAIRDSELVEALIPDEETPVDITPPLAEIPPGLKERKKKDKKSSRPISEDPLGRDFEGSKHVAKKNEPLTVTKQPTPPEASSFKKKSGQKKHKNEAATSVSEQFDSYHISPERLETATQFAEPREDASLLWRQDNDPGQDMRSTYIKEHSDTVQTIGKKQEPVHLPIETKPNESGLAKRKNVLKKQRIEAVSASADNLPMKSAIYIPLDNAQACGHAEKKEVVADDKSHVISSGMQKNIAKKQRNECDKENADIKFKDFLSSLKNMTFTEEEAIYVAEILKDKAMLIQDIWQKPGVKCDPVPGLQQQLQDKEKLLRAIQDEVTLGNDKCKQLNQDLVAEKQKANVVESKLREQRSALEKELGALQNKLQVSYQDHVNETQMQFRQLQEQTDALKQENRILRDAVSKAPSQLESKQSTELNKLRQDYARLMNEFTEKTNRLQQEELQKKNLEVSYEQTVQQLKTKLQEEVERRKEEVQKYLRNITAEHEKRLTEIQNAKQDLQNKFRVVENEIGNKNEEVQSLHSKLTDTMLSKQQLEQKMVQLVNAEQKRANADDALKIQLQDLLEQKQIMNAQIQNLHAQLSTQASAASVVEELQKKVLEKERQMKLMEESLHLRATRQDQDIKSLQKDKKTLTAEVQKLQVQTSNQSSVFCKMDQMQIGLQERDEKIKTVEELLESGLIQMANKGEEIENMKKENKSLRQKIQELEVQNAEQMSSVSRIAELQKIIHEKNEAVDSIEGLLESQIFKIESNEQTIQALRKENGMLKGEVQSAQQVSSVSKIAELQKIIHEKNEVVDSIEGLLESQIFKIESNEQTIQTLRKENGKLKGEVQSAQQVSTSSKMDDLEKIIGVQEQELSHLKAALAEEAANKMAGIQEESLSVAAELQKSLIEKDEKIKKVEDQLEKELIKLENNGQKIQDLQQENDLLQRQIENVQLQKEEQDSIKANQNEESQIRLETKEQEINSLKTTLTDSREAVAGYMIKLQDLQHQNAELKILFQQLQDKTSEQDSALLKSEVLLNVLSEKDQEIDSLHREIEPLKAAVNQQRMKNNELREKNWKAMEALTSTEKMLQDKVNKTAKESNQQVVAIQSQSRDVMKRLFPKVLVSSAMDYADWLQEFESAAQQILSSLLEEQTQVLEQKEKETEEMQAMLQLECEKYKTVLAETEGILQRLQSSVEEEEGKWKMKLEESQKTLMQMQSSVHTLEQELETTKHENTETESLRKQNNHIASELEKVELERATCVTEVRELKVLLTELQKRLDDSCAEAIKQNEELSLLKSQLNETSIRLKTEQNEAQKVVSNLYEAQESLNIIHAEVARTIKDEIVVENSDVPEVKEQLNIKKKISEDLNQNIIQLQQLLEALMHQFSKGRENSQNVFFQLEQKAIGAQAEGASF